MQGNVDEESDWGSHGLRMDDLRNCQGRGAAHANRLQGLAISRSRKVVNLKWIVTHAIQCSCYWRLRIWSDRLPDPSRSRANQNRGDRLIAGPGPLLIATSIFDIPTYHPIQASKEHNAHIIRVIDTFTNRKANDSDMIKTNADAKTDEDASPISCRRRRSRPTPKRPSARYRRPGNTAVAPFD